MGEFKKLRGANTVAVGWMGDIWAYSGLNDPKWMDMMHPLMVASHMGKNTLLFLTRNPSGYLDAEKAYRFGPKAWLGITVTSQADVDRIGPDFASVDHPRKFVSFEPMLGEIRDWGKLGPFEWLYMGALTDGRGRVVREPALTWLVQARQAASDCGAKVWEKNSLSYLAAENMVELGGLELRKETPWLRGPE